MTALAGSPSRNVAHTRLKSGYVDAKGTALATPTEFMATMYKVSPIPKPITPLATIGMRVSRGKLVTAPALPDANRIIARTTALLAQRTMFAEIGFVLNNTRL